MLSIGTAFFFAACSGTQSSSVNTDAQAVEAAKSALAVGFGPGDTASIIRFDITLPSSFGNGVSVAWESSVPSVISDTGAVSRPADTNEAVTLSAALTKGSETAEKVFPLTVYGINQEKVDNVKENLSIATIVSSGTASISLPASDAAFPGVGIEWSSVPAGIIGSPVNGTAAITIPPQTTTVTLTAAISVTGAAARAEKSFSVTVYAAGDEPSADDYIAAAKNDLVIQYAAGDSAASVTKDIVLPVSGANGVSVSWSVQTGKTAWCSAAGKITRDIADIDIQLTAALRKTGGTSVTKTFDITVSRIPLIEPSPRVKYFFAGNVLTIEEVYNGSLDEGGKYNCTIDPAAKKLSVSQTHLYEDGKWFSKAEYVAAQKEDMVSTVRSFKQMSENQTVTQADVIALFKSEAEDRADAPQTDAQVAAYIISQYGQMLGCSSADDFYALSSAGLTAKMHELCDMMLLMIQQMYNISVASWDEALVVMAEIAEKKATLSFVTAKFTYDVTFDASGTCTNFSAESYYDTDKAWHEQYGSYELDSSGNVELSLWQGLWFFHHDNSSGNPLMFNSDFTSFEDNGTTWTVTSNPAAEAVTVSSASNSYVLTFEGYSLW